MSYRAWVIEMTETYLDRIGGLIRMRASIVV